MNRKIDIRNGDHSVSKPTLGIQIEFSKKSEKRLLRVFLIGLQIKQDSSMSLFAYPSVCLSS